MAQVGKQPFEMSIMDVLPPRGHLPGSIADLGHAVRSTTLSASETLCRARRDLLRPSPAGHG